MGGVGDWSNTAWDLVGQESDYRSIPIPLGLFQVFENLDVFNPDSDDFDPALVMSYASSPLHYTFSRGGTDAGRSFLLDIVNAEISRDLNAYRGFDPKEDLRAGGLAAPDWGRTFWVYEDGTASHGFYVGAGPYLSIETELVFDDRLVELWASEADIYFPNSSFTVLNETRTQGAGALTFGYRARLPLVGNTNSDRNGIYVATNYNYLYGIYYEDFDIDILFDTDDEGLLTLAPTTDPATIERFASADGRGI
jgi:hypothetical protein